MRVHEVIVDGDGATAVAGLVVCDVFTNPVDSVAAVVPCVVPNPYFALTTPAQVGLPSCGRVSQPGASGRNGAVRAACALANSRTRGDNGVARCVAAVTRREVVPSATNVAHQETSLH
jgi:hypothetical protein